MATDIYLLCGLGADERLFGYLDLSPYNVTPVRWEVPGKGESMASYAKRLLPQITSKRPVLMGVSFGGMLAIEIGKQIATDKIILISSAAVKKEIPWMYRLGKITKLHRLAPGKVLKHAHMFMNWIMGAKDPVRRELLKTMLHRSDPRFLTWAIDKVVTWDNITELPNVVRIHGTADRVLPFVKADYVIEGGGHLIVANRAREVDMILREIFQH